MFSVKSCSKILIHSLQEFLSIQVILACRHLVSMDANSQVLGHFATFHSFNTNLFQRVGKLNQRFIIVEFTTESIDFTAGFTGLKKD